MAYEMTEMRDTPTRVFLADSMDDPTLPEPGNRHPEDSRFVADTKRKWWYGERGGDTSVHVPYVRERG